MVFGVGLEYWDVNRLAVRTDDHHDIARNMIIRIRCQQVQAIQAIMRVFQTACP
jgi:hypothetical protein